MISFCVIRLFKLRPSATGSALWGLNDFALYSPLTLQPVPQSDQVIPIWSGSTDGASNEYGYFVCIPSRLYLFFEHNFSMIIPIQPHYLDRNSSHLTLFVSYSDNRYQRYLVILCSRTLAQLIFLLSYA